MFWSIRRSRCVLCSVMSTHLCHCCPAEGRLFIDFPSGVYLLDHWAGMEEAAGLIYPPPPPEWGGRTRTRWPIWKNLSSIRLWVCVCVRARTSDWCSFPHVWVMLVLLQLFIMYQNFWEACYDTWLSLLEGEKRSDSPWFVETTLQWRSQLKFQA